MDSVYTNQILYSHMLKFYTQPRETAFAGRPGGGAGKSKNPFEGGAMPSMVMRDVEPIVKVHENGDVFFRFFAPNAEKVEIEGKGGGMPSMSGI